MSESKTNKDLEYSRQLQEKFELYLLGLNFTLLVLAIQTAKFGNSQAADLLEVTGWMFLLLSGLVGLSRIEWLPVIYKSGAQLSELKEECQKLLIQKQQGFEELPVSDHEKLVSTQVLIEDRKSAIQKLAALVSKLEQRNLRKYGIHKWTFVFGLLLLASARAYTPVSSVVHDLLVNAPGSVSIR